MSLLKKIKALFYPKQTEKEKRYEAAIERQKQRQTQKLDSDSLEFTKSGHFFKPDFMQKKKEKEDG